MNEKKVISPRAFQAWKQLERDYALGQEVLGRLQIYVDELLSWNEKSNLTRIIDDYEVVEYHIRDSLVFAKAVDCGQPLLLCDVGTGGGLPGIPLKIVYPHLNIILLEVVDKKVAFLNHAIAHLELEGIEVCTLDWRTFLRTTQAPIDYFIARASLRPDELLRMYKPGSAYTAAQVVYWASDFWEPENEHETSLMRDFYPYVVGTKKRRLVFFSELKAR